VGAVDRHIFYRQGIMRLHMTWKTKSWQTRVQLEILALALVDSFCSVQNCCLNGFMTQKMKKVLRTDQPRSNRSTIRWCVPKPEPVTQDHHRQTNDLKGSAIKVYRLRDKKGKRKESKLMLG
jgi:hypothetical protein